MNEQYLENIKNKLKDSFDVKYREIELLNGVAHAVYVDNLCDSKFISQYIIGPLLKNNDIKDIDSIKKEVLYANNVGEVNTEEEAIQHILSGDVVLVFDFGTTVLYCEAKGFAKRSVDIPPTESVLKGPREGFVENVVDNIALVRRKIKNENLKFENMNIGSESNTVVVMSYLKGSAPQKLLNHIRNKLQNININFVMDINYIEEELKNKHTVFDTVGYTEKPDIAASKLLEGKVIIMVDGTSSVIIAPYFFIENLQAADDYYLNKTFTSIARIQRWLSFFISITLPGLYVALSTYHFSLIPTVFVVKLSNSRAGVPFPTVVEVLLMLGFFQLLREAGIRLPQPTAQSMSIVGALILGDAAVGAGLASESTIVIVAIASIATFLVPNLYRASVLWNIVVIIFSSLLGLPGFYISILILIIHLSSLKSCEYPYLFPVGTLQTYKYRDIFIRSNVSDISKNIFDEGDDV